MLYTYQNGHGFWDLTAPSADEHKEPPERSHIAHGNADHTGTLKTSWAVF